MKTLLRILFLTFIASPLLEIPSFAAENQPEVPAVSVRQNSFQSDCPIIRAERPFRFTAVVETQDARETSAYACRVIMPEDGSMCGEARSEQTSRGVTLYTWDAVCAQAGEKTFTLELSAEGKPVQKVEISQAVLPPRAVEKLDYIPQPRPVKTDILVGAHNCPLWERQRAHLWDQVVKKHQERTPALGIYSQDNPEIADWETKWAVEHGISFFIYCWYRTSQGGAITTQFEKSVFDDAMFLSKFADRMQFTIMWENQSRGTAGVSDEKDLLENLLPYWIEKFFKRENYLKIDNKPVLFVYRPEMLPDDLGDVDAVRAAFDKMRAACKAAGFDGLTIFGEYRGTNREHLGYLNSLGLDAVFSYVIPVPESRPAEDIIRQQMDFIRRQQQMRDILPTIITLSQAWSGWQDEGPLWKLPPADFETLLREAKTLIEKEVPAESWAAKMVILDNWNEWSEGHYIAPYREYGFGYLDAVRRVFSQADEAHEDLLPEDIGMGPYSLPAAYFQNRTAWDFRVSANEADPRQPWTPMMNVRDFACDENGMRFVTASADPAIHVLQDATPAEDFSTLRFRMKTSVAKPDVVQFFWKTQDGADYSEAASVRAAVAPGGEFAEYVLNLKENPRWTGRVVEIRLDPVSTPDVTVEIQRIEMK